MKLWQILQRGTNPEMRNSSRCWETQLDLENAAAGGAAREIGINPPVWNKSCRKVTQTAANPAAWNCISSLDTRRIPQNVRRAAPGKGNSDKSRQRRLKANPARAYEPWTRRRRRTRDTHGRNPSKKTPDPVIFPGAKRTPSRRGNKRE